MTINNNAQRENRLKRKLSEDFWLKKISGTDYSQLYSFKRQSDGGEYDAIGFNLPFELINKIEVVSKGDAKSKFVLLCAALSITHYFYTQKSGIIINSPDFIFHNAASDNKRQLFFAIELSLETRLADVVKIVKSEFETAFRNRDYDDVRFLERAASLVSGNVLHQLGLSLDGVNCNNYEGPRNELTFRFEQDLSFGISFVKGLFDPNLVVQYADHYVVVLNELLYNSKKRIIDLQWLTKEQSLKLLSSFNDTFTSFPEDKTIVDLVEEACIHYPQNIAVQTLSGQLTFQQLKFYSDALARLLIEEYNLPDESIISVLLDRNEWIIISILGILKAGFAFLPIDPNYPKDRVQYIINDSESPLVLTEDIFAHLLDGHNYLDITSIAKIEQSTEVNRAKSKGLAYVIYTSGSTGKPKGVLVEHMGLTNHINWFSKAFSIKPADSTLLVSSYSWDGSYSIIWSSLVNGSTLHILPNELIIDSDFFLEYIANNSISFLKLVPSFFAAIVSSPLFESEFTNWSVRLIVLGGEIVNVDHVNKYLSKHPDTLFVNHYGPTEATIGACCQLISAESFHDFATLPVIGSPFDNCEIYILGKNRELLPIGVLGEIYIGGVGVARGYHNQPQLTGEKFIDHPFKDEGKIYRTGDFGFWTCDGKIVFKGREDFQVKLRGYRIELGEIEQVLTQLDFIQEAVVLVNTASDGSELLSFIKSSEKLDVVFLRKHLQTLLPDFMVPAVFIQVDRIPLTLNGKIDKQSLIQLRYETSLSGADYVPPGNEMESQLARVLSSVLKIKNVGMKDDFFVLGGDSIKAIQVVSMLRREGYLLNIKDILLTPGVGQLVTKIIVQKKQLGNYEAVEGVLSLSPIQRSFLGSLQPELHHYNQSVLLYSRERIDGVVLREILGHLAGHHDALRMVYRRDASGDWEQYNEGLPGRYDLQEYDYSGVWEQNEELSGYCGELQSGMELGSGPMLRAGLFHCHDGDRLLLVIHHLVVDGVSWRILFEDLSQLYSQYKSGTPLRLPLKTDSFRYWQQQQELYSQSSALRSEVSYWGWLERQSWPGLPKDYPGGVRGQDQEGQCSFTLDAEQTRLLQTRCHSVYRTEINDLLLTGLGVSLRETFGVDQVLVSLEGHGREEIGGEADVTRTVGWFTTEYPVLLDMSGGEDVESVLVRVKEHLHRVPNKGIGYGILRYMSGSSFRGGQEYKVRPEISFNYLGDFGSGLETGSGERLFEFSGGYQGSTASPLREREESLTVSGIIIEGSLTLSVSYNGGEFAGPTITSLMSSYQATLEELTSMLGADREHHLTPVDLTYQGLSIRDLSLLNRDNDLEDVYPLSPLQEGLYYHWLSDPGSGNYFEQMLYEIGDETLDLDALEKSYAYIVGRHTILRTSFTLEYGEPLQVVRRQVRSGFRYQDVSQEGSFSVSGFSKADRDQGFTLGEGSQMRLTVLRTGAGTYSFVWSHHHILMDGWCVGVIINEFYGAYRSYRSGSAPEPVVPAYPYVNYIKWLGGLDKGSSQRYWQGYLSGYETLTGIPVQGIPGLTPGRHSHQWLVISGSQLQGMRTVCGELGITENTFIQAVWGLLLSRYNNTEDVVFGSVVSGRPGELEGVETMIGLFINTVPVRVRYDHGTGVAELLRGLQAQNIEGLPHHYVQLAEIQSSHELGSGLLDHILVFQNYPVQELISGGAAGASDGGLGILSAEVFEQTNYRLTVVIVPSADQIKIDLGYDSGLYQGWFMEQLSGHFSGLVTSVLEDRSGLVGSLAYMDSQEQEKLGGFTGGAEVSQGEETLLDLFRAQVELRGEETAVVFEDSSLTYRELDARSNQLAHYLVRRGVKPGSLVPVCVERSLEMIIGLLGILKSGGAYVPIDPDYPSDRIRYILEDTSAELLLSSGELLGAVSGHRELVLMDREGSQISKEATTGPGIKIAPGSLAYVIYTSGSTGRPKGVMVEHGNVVSLLKPGSSLFDFNSEDVWTMFHSYCFDFSVWEMYGAMVYGARLIIIPKELTKDPVLFGKLLVKEKVTILNQTPAAFYGLQEEMINNYPATNLRYVIFGGEALNPVMLKEWKTNYPSCQLINMYGITETTVHVTYKEINQQDISRSLSNIGRPIPTLNCFILNRYGQLQPVGIPGELYIGGSGVSHGYLNRAELTLERFVANPYGPGRLYRTGDLGRWLPDGNIEYLGRMDDQVKIRGYRIELGEIESVLVQHAGISEALVVAREQVSGDKYLAAYYVSSDGRELDSRELKEYLGGQLPGYMVPAAYVWQEQFRLTANGKIDKKSLPEPEATGGRYVAPRNEIEERLAEIWQEVLSLERVGVDDDFFEVGGHSLKATRIISQLYRQFGVILTIKELFSNPTLENQAQIIAKTQKIAYVNIERVDIQPDYPLSPSQKRFWTMSQLAQGNVAYNIPLSYILEGKLNPTALAFAIDALIERHESLRTIFRENEQNAVRQIILPSSSIEFNLIEKDLRNEENKDEQLKHLVEEEFIKPFDLSSGPLIRINLFQLTDTIWALTCVMHHIISDGWSMDILIKELISFYNNFNAGYTPALPSLSIQYKDYAAWQQNQLVGKEFEDHKAYWLEQFHGELPLLELPIDKARQSIRTYNGKELNILIDSDMSKAIKHFCQAQGGSLFMGLLAAINTLLYRYSNQEDIIIGSPISGRQHADLDNQIGAYINTLAFRTRFSRSDSFLELFEKTKNLILNAYEHQIFPFDELITLLPLKGEKGRSILFDTMVVWINGDQDESMHQMTNLSIQKYSGSEYFTSKNDLTFYFREAGENIQSTLRYNSELFDESTINRMGSYLKKLLEAIAKSPGDTITQLVYKSELNSCNLIFRPNGSRLHERSCQEKKSLLLDSLEKDNESIKTNSCNNLSFIARTKDKIDIDTLQAALNHLIKKHEILSILFDSDSAGSTQTAKENECAVQFQQLDEINEDELDNYFKGLIAGPSYSESDSFFRVRLIQFNKNNYAIVLIAHQIVFDRKSLEILFSDLIKEYNGIDSNDLDSADLSYLQFYEWQNELNDNDYEPFYTYWKRKLKNAPFHGLDTERPRTNNDLYTAELFHLGLEPALSDSIFEFCKNKSISPFVFLLSAFQVLLNKYSGASDIVVGTLCDYRVLGEIARMTGPLTNLVILRTETDEGLSFVEYLNRVANEYEQSTEFGKIPLKKIAKDYDADAFRQFIFNYEDNLIDSSVNKIFTQYELNSGLGNFDLNLLIRKNENLNIYLTFNNHFFTKENMQGLVLHYINVIKNVLTAPEKKIKEVDYLSQKELDQILSVYNSADVNYPTDKTIVTLFEEQVATTPGNIAVTYQSVELTYSELNERANQLAGFLKKTYQIQRDDLIAIILDRSEWMIISILAVLKSGAAYVPIDPNYPQDRIDYMLSKCNSKVKIDDSQLDIFRNKEHSCSSGNLPAVNDPSDLAYVIFTSGTTGKPKGTLIEHRNVVRLFKNEKPLFDFTGEDVWTMFHSFCFDFSVWEMYGALLNGGKLVVIPSLATKDPELFIEILKDEKVTVLNQTPSSFNNITSQELLNKDAELSLRYVIFGGEALNPGTLQLWKQKYPETSLINMYGITETTVHVTYKEITDEEIRGNISNIGSPIPTLGCYVLDQNRNLLPFGVTGELYIEGEGLARGYLNDEPLTDEKFITNPFKKNKKLYRSGDKVKQLRNGDLIYVGRIDDQVKIRGYRIELGEIESAVLSHPQVKSAVVLARSVTDGMKELVAYLTSSAGINITELRSWLSLKLPSHMLPSYYVLLDHLPLTSTGKVDKRSLPDPVGIALGSGVDYVAPKTDLESQMVRIWQDILGSDRIGIHDNFFDLGGHSLKATQLANQIYKELNIKLKLEEIFMMPTIEELGNEIMNKQWLTVEDQDIQAKVNKIII